MIFSIGFFLVLLGCIYGKLFGEPYYYLVGRYETNSHDVAACICMLIGFFMMVYSLLALAWKYLP